MSSQEVESKWKRVFTDLRACPCSSVNEVIGFLAKLGNEGFAPPTRLSIDQKNDKVVVEWVAEVVENQRSEEYGYLGSRYGTHMIR